MSKRKGKAQSASQKILWVLSLTIVGSMVLSLIIVALPSGTEQAPMPLPTFTPFPTRTPPPSPTLEPTVPLVGPVLPTITEAITSTVELTAPPMGPVLPTATP